jgi:lysophospholipase L1-like esterase
MRKILVAGLAILMLSCSPVDKYKNNPEVLGWEKDIQVFGQLDKAEQYPGDAILFAGSSSIRLWDSIAFDMAPYHVIRRGYGGARLSDFAIYADRIIAPHTCRAIVIYIANDITGNKNDKKTWEVARLFRYTLNEIRKSHPVTPVFWIAITPTASRWAVWEKIRLANNIIKHICENSPNTYFINTDFAFIGSDGKPKTDLFVEDKLHLNRQGYTIWTGIIKKELDNILTEKK